MMMDDCSLPVQLYFSARKLRDLDFFSKSDPFVKLSLQKTLHGNFDFAGRTETAKNTINPNWVDRIAIQYFFEVRQAVLIEVYDEDSSSNADFIGRAQTTMGNIMGAHQQTLILNLTDPHGKETGKIIVRAEKVEQSSHELTMDWKGGKIANVDSHFDFWDKSDPYLKFIKIREDNTLIEVGRTEVLFDNQSPNWKPISFPASRLLNMKSPNASFKVQCWDHDQKDHKHKLIGETYVSSQDLKNRPCPIQYNLQNPNIKKPGTLILQRFSMLPVYNFIDYLKSGLQLNLVVAIDFTASNGHPNTPQSLHCIENQPTQYQQVMKGIWDIVESYDSDKKIPAFGFGAKPHFPNLNENTANHCFHINDNPHNPQIMGFGNLMNCYVQAVRNMELAGPTYFAPVLKEAFRAASSLANSFSYQIFLILTDGAIHDMAATKNLIVNNANLPMSIIIVGIGNADFSSMRELDGDEHGLRSTAGQKCPRDIIQFVPYNKYNGNPQLLTAELLKEIPNQVTQYFKLVGRPPQPQVATNMEEIHM